MPSEQSIKSFWNQAAEDNPYWYVSSYGAYDAKRNLDEFWASGRKIWSDLKQLSGYSPKASDSVVEIGCGVGRLTRVIAPEVGQVIALDISEKMLGIARQAKLSNVDFRAASGFELTGLADKSVDLALGYCVFQHLPSLDALKSYLHEMHRVARPGGMLIFTLVPRDWKDLLLPLLRVRAYLKERFSSGQAKGIYRKEWVGIRPDRREVLEISPITLEQRGLDSERVVYFGRC